MLKQYHIFFDFLRSCIGSDSEPPLSLREADWNEIYAIAQKQCLLGVLFDGIERLPADSGISKELLYKWMGQCRMLEKANAQLNEAAVKVSNWFQKKGFRTCLLKGQGNALLYPNVAHRTPGDIDIWVEGGDKKVISFVRTILPNGKACYHHIDFPSYNGVEVEVHYRPSFWFCFRHDSRLQEYYKRVEKEQFSHRVMLEGYGEIAIPTSEFNIIFQLTHIFTHLMNEGIGLRQLLDYYYVLVKSDEVRVKYCTISEGKANVISLQKELKHLGLRKFAGAVMYVLHEALGLPKEKMIAPMDEHEGRFLLDEIMLGGNFGQYDDRLGCKDNEGKLHRYFRMNLRNLRFVKHYPTEALSEPFFRTWFAIWKKVNGIT